MTRGQIPRKTAPAKTDLVLLKVDPFFTTGLSTHEGSPVEDFFAHIPSPVILTGDGRVYNHIRVGAMAWHPGVAAPTESDVGIFHTLAFDSSHDDEVHFTLLIPFRIEAGSEIGVGVDWAYTGGADAGTVCWGLEYKSITAGDALVGGTTTELATSPGTHASGELVRTTFPTGIVGAVCHEVLGLRLYRDVSGDSLGTDAELVEVHFEYLRDKHGLAV